MAHSLKDALAVLSVIQGEDSDDVSTLNVNRTLDSIAPKPSLRIGALPANKFTVATQKLYAKQLQTLKDAGHTVVNVAVKDDLSTLYVDEYAILLYDFKAEINHYLSKTPTQVTVKSLDELIAFNIANKQQSLKYLTIIVNTCN